MRNLWKLFFSQLHPNLSTHKDNNFLYLQPTQRLLADNFAILFSYSIYIKIKEQSSCHLFAIQYSYSFLRNKSVLRITDTLKLILLLSFHHKQQVKKISKLKMPLFRIYNYFLFQSRVYISKITMIFSQFLKPNGQDRNQEHLSWSIFWLRHLQPILSK